MSLPKLDIITHTVSIPSTKKEIRIRPFLVKEQKILLTALTSESAEDVSSATKQIVNNCVVTPGFDVDSLELFDLEYLILQLRILSVGETTKIRFQARENTSCKQCSKHRDVEINLKEAGVDMSTMMDKKIQLTSTVGLIMKYPTTKILSKIESIKDSNDIDDLFKIVWSCVECVYEKDKITSSKDVTPKEAIEFLESLSAEQFSKLETFISSIPKLKQTITVKCSECEFQQNFTLVGLNDFFV